jgi:hypothetical protein
MSGIKPRPRIASITTDHVRLLDNITAGCTNVLMHPETEALNSCERSGSEGCGSADAPLPNALQVASPLPNAYCILTC